MGRDTEATLPVYLIHWNAPEWCGAAARSLLASRDVDTQLTVVDNGQVGGLPLRGCLPAGVRVLEQATNGGYTAGANAALDDWARTYPDQPFAVLGSHDLHVEADALGRLLATARQYPDGGVLGPAITAPRPASGGIASGSRWFQLPLEGAPVVAERDWVNGTCLFLRRSCVDDVGSFDERLGSYAEDVDYGLRARDHGWRVLVDTRARAHGLGTVSERAPDDKVVNTVLLTAKRSGLPGAATWIARLAYRTVVDGTRSALPGAGAAGRRRAAADARQNGRILIRLLADARLPAMLRPGGDP